MAWRRAGKLHIRWGLVVVSRPGGFIFKYSVATVPRPHCRQEFEAGCCALAYAPAASVIDRSNVHNFRRAPEKKHVTHTCLD